MRYTRKQIVTTTVSDDEIKDHAVIKELFINICNASVDIVLEYRDEKLDIVRTLERTRILEVFDDRINVRTFMNNGSLLIPKILFDNIISVKLTTSKNNIVAGSDNVSKFELLDI